MSFSKPTIVIVPGAWNSPIHYRPLVTELTALSYPTLCLALPSTTSATPKEVTVTKDAAFIRENMLMPLLEQGKDVVVLCHCYGGCPGGVAVKGLSKEERTSQGSRGGIIGLVYLSAFVMNQGDSLLSKAGGSFSPWIDEHKIRGVVTASAPVSIFYGDLPVPAALKAVTALRPQATKSFTSKCGAAGWADRVYDDRRTYIICNKDNTIEPEAQNLMIEFSAAPWKVREMNTSHSPFISQPKQLAGTIAALATDYEKIGSEAMDYLKVKQVPVAVVESEIAEIDLTP